MKLVRFGLPGQETPGVLLEDSIVDLRSLDPGWPLDWRSVLAADGLGRLADLLPRATAKHRVDPATVRLGAPIDNPSKVICIGMNYADHAAEQNRPLPEKPLLFAKAPSALCGPEDNIVLPAAEEKPDVEAELAVVIGKRARHLAASDWQDVVAGYMCFNDVSGRGAQYGDRQWFRGKSYDTFAPCGPYLVTRDAVIDPHVLSIGTVVNDFVLQDSNTSNLVFRIPDLLAYITASMTLLPGDILATGTPAGVGVFRDPPRFLQPGDRVTVTIEGLGCLRNNVVAEEITGSAG
jgi:2-keto-4-pentenoate hydratase/2-oxohepta-3-ene-1,7-dioic acid hydratase in catechol pathway